MQLSITTHCKERYVERVNGGNPVDIVTILQKISAGKDITNKVLDDAPRYILYLYERYEECGLTVIKNDDIIFILKRKEGTYNTFSVLTCYKDVNFLEQFKNTSMPRAEIYIKIRLKKAELKKKKR